MKNRSKIEKIIADLTAKYESNTEFYIEETDNEIIAYGYDDDFGCDTQLEAIKK